ncbi:hypothetical protein BpHYR1_023476 [Brachionus plicatilis]|uniref:Uncharacterized protein n=1 Tax=Brachionus plicatilis TaxID=10195 RepID=A0A3M7QAI6_BRAPC|nr:hypothetical protein BpHYR1_023476 [Brachionus plicatilis]
MLIANNYNRPSYELSSNLNLEIKNKKIEKVSILTPVLISKLISPKQSTNVAIN